MRIAAYVVEVKESKEDGSVVRRELWWNTRRILAVTVNNETWVNDQYTTGRVLHQFTETEDGKLIEVPM